MKSVYELKDSYEVNLSALFFPSANALQPDGNRSVPRSIYPNRQDRLPNKDDLSQAKSSAELLLEFTTLYRRL